MAQTVARGPQIVKPPDLPRVKKRKILKHREHREHREEPFTGAFRAAVPRNWLSGLVANELWTRSSSVFSVFSVFQSLFAVYSCLLYTSDAADERSSVDLG